MSDTEERRPAPSAGSVVAAEREHRLAKLDRLRERGIAPYPVKFDRDHTIGEIRENYARWSPARRPRRRCASPGA